MLCNILLTALKKIIAALVVGRTLQDTVLWSWVWKGEGCIQISIFLYRCSESKQLCGLQFFVWKGARVYSVSGLENTIWGEEATRINIASVVSLISSIFAWLSANFFLFLLSTAYSCESISLKSMQHLLIQHTNKYKVYSKKWKNRW